MKKKLLPIALVLMTSQANADIKDSISEFIYNQQFAQAETDFIQNNNMDVSNMLSYAYNARDQAADFADWLESNHPTLYRKHVMVSSNFPNHPFTKKNSYYNGGLADTFRHMFWSAQIAKKYGRSLAREYTDLHELINKEENSINPNRNKVVLNKNQQRVLHKKWKYFEVRTDNLHSQLKVTIDNLSSDVDLYVRKGSKPTLSSYNCRSWKGGTNNEICNIDIWQSTKYYIGIHGYSAGEFNLRAILVDDQGSSDNGIWSNLTPMDYHNNYIGAAIGSQNNNLSTNNLAKKVREYIMGDINYSINFNNSHTQLPQNRPVIYKDFNNNSSRALKTFNPNSGGNSSIDELYNTYPNYFGSKVGGNYTCFTNYTCQNFSTGKKIAVHNQNGSLYYNTGSNWYRYAN